MIDLGSLGIQVTMNAASALPTSAYMSNIPKVETGRLEAMYRAHHRVIWRTLRRLGFEPEAAADYTQQAYLIAVERIDDIYLGSEKAFLFSTAIRLAKTAARKQRRMDYSDDLDLGSDLGRSARAADDRQVALQLLERVLSHLDMDLLTVFSLYEIEGLSSPEIAEILGIPVGTVASRLRRARELFRRKAAQLESQFPSLVQQAGGVLS